MKVVAFHLNQFSLRGTEVAIYDYADYGQKVLGIQPVIVAPLLNRKHNPQSFLKFKRRFPVKLYRDRKHLAKLASGFDALYALKGAHDDLALPGVRNLVHGVFRSCPPHGDRFAYISEPLAKACPGNHAWVPHIVTVPPPGLDDYRLRFEIPPDAVVFGRHGGYKTFDIDFAQREVYAAVERNPKVWFMFLNTKRFGPRHPRVIHLPGTAKPELKAKFIRSCDAMLHARRDGETFGLAIAEFSVLLRPTLTWTGSEDRAHLDFLGDTVLGYSNQSELAHLIDTFDTAVVDDPKWDVYSERFAPKPVMEKFREVFLS